VFGENFSPISDGVWNLYEIDVKDVTFGFYLAGFSIVKVVVTWVA